MPPRLLRPRRCRSGATLWTTSTPSRSVLPLRPPRTRWPTSRTSSIATTTSEQSARATSSTTTSSRINSRCPHERRLPPRRGAGRSGRSRVPAPGSSTYSKTSAPIDAAEVEREITAPDSNRKILEEIKRYAEEHEEEYGRFPKTLIFAVNDLPHTSHADQLVDQARDVFGRGEAFVAKITGRVDRPLQRIREFRNRPNPAIVVTVDLLTTGVDIPDLEFIVFLRPVKSRILFEQMLGRGTRRATSFPDKSHFVVFDCFDGTLFEYFRRHDRNDRRATRA